MTAKPMEDPMTCGADGSKITIRPETSQKRRLAARRHGAEPLASAELCRMGAAAYGGLRTGPKTPEGIEHIRRAVTKHGRYSKAAKVQEQRLSAVVKDVSGDAGWPARGAVIP